MRHNERSTDVLLPTYDTSSPYTPATIWSNSTDCFIKERRGDNNGTRMEILCVVTVARVENDCKLRRYLQNDVKIFCRDRILPPQRQ